jgi:hypothetical protein
VVSLVALNDDAQALFSTAASTFNGLTARADNGVVVNVDVTSTSGSMHLDGDADDSSSADDANSVFVEGNVTVTAHAVMTLEASAGSIEAAGKLTLRAGTGIVILDNMSGAASAKALVMHSDFESAGDGVLTVWTGKSVSSS